MAKKKTGKNSAKTAKRSSGKVSALSFALLALIGGMVSTSVGILLGFSDVGRTANAFVQETAQNDANALALAVTRQLQVEQQRMLTIANASTVISWAEQGNPDKQIDRLLSGWYPEALKVEYFPKGFRTTNLEDTPPTGFAAIEMIEKAEQSKKAPGLEVHLPADTTLRHILFMQPVINEGGEVLGTLAVWQPTIELLKPVTWLSPEKRLVVVEHKAPGGGTISMMTYGDTALEGINPVLGQVKELPWTIKSRMKPPMADTLGLDMKILVTWGSVGLLIQLIVAGILFALLKAALKSDASVFQTIMSELKGNSLSLEYHAKLAELDDVVGPITKMAWDIKEEQDTGGGSSIGGSSIGAKAAYIDAVASPNTESGVMESTLSDGLEVVETEEGDAAGLFDDLMNESLDVTPLPLVDESDTPEMPASIFRAYDIRGVVGDTLNADIVYWIGRAIGSEAGDRGLTEVAVGRDGRLSGEELQGALIKGILESGVDVLNVGMVPTPVLYFAAHQYSKASGVMVTGSHNPPDYNGFKIMLGGETFSGDLITGLRKRILERRLSSGEGQSLDQRVDEDYMDYITNDVSLMRPLKIVVDCGNGVAGKIAPELFRNLGCEVEELYCEVDGRFPNHHPDPSEPENLEALMSLVRIQGADLGLAFDGDGDRLGVVDSKGIIIWPDRQMMMFSKDVLMRNPGSDIIFDVKCTNQLAQVITENAGVPVMWKTGHSFIKKKLKETGAPLAGEMSGHIFFSERWFGFDDGIYSGCRLLEILSADERKSDEIFAELPNSVNTPELKVPMQEGEPQQFISAFVAQAAFSDASVSTIDGIRADFGDGWGLVRASNTTPVLVCRFDANSQEALDRIKTRFKEAMLAVRSDLNIPF